MCSFSARMASTAAVASPATADARTATSDDATAAPLVELYEQHSGDLVAIFAALGDNPGKAIKYPPSDAREFASKYIGGFYTYIDIKSAFEKAGLTYKDPASEAAAPEPTPEEDP